MDFFKPKLDPSGRRAILPGETLYEFNCRSNAPELVDGRKQANEWLQEYPTKGLTELTSRLKSRSEHDHYSAVQELQLFSVLKSSGFEIDICTQNLGSTPDFELRFPGNQTCYVEATIALNQEKAQLNDLLHTATRQLRMTAPRLRIWTSQRRTTPRTPKASLFVRFLLEEYKTLLQANPQAREDGFCMLGDSLIFHDPVSDWRIKLAILQAPLGEIPDATIEYGSIGESFWADPVGHLKKKIREKVRQHKKIAEPMFLAIGWHDFKHKPSQSDVLKSLTEATDPLGAKIAGLIFTDPSPMLPFLFPSRSEIWLHSASPSFIANAAWPFKVIIYDLKKGEIVNQSS